MRNLWAIRLARLTFGHPELRESAASFIIADAYLYGAP